MPGDEEVSLETVYAEVDKRIKAANDALKTELMAYLESCGIRPKKAFKIINRPAANS